MAANPPYDGAVLVLGTMDEVGIPLLEKADDPQDVIAYAGYGFWAPSALVSKVKGLKADTDHKVGPIAPIKGEQAIDIPDVDGDVADPKPQGDKNDPGDAAPKKAPKPVEPEADDTENDPTSDAVGTQPSKRKAEKPVENTAAADDEDPTNQRPSATAAK